MVNYRRNASLIGTGLIEEKRGVYDLVFSGHNNVVPGTDITNSWYEISNRSLDSESYMGSTADYNGPYDVGEIQTNFVGSGRIYIGVKVTVSPTYYNDVPIAGVQVVNSNNDTLVEDYIFSNSGGGTGGGWKTVKEEVSGSSSQGFPNTPSWWSSRSYYSITTAANEDKFSWASSTGSWYTGCAGGVSSGYNTTLAPVGNAQISQVGSNYYAYRETSGSTRWSGVVMRSPSRTFSGGEWIRVIHALTGRTSNPISSTDTLYIAVI